MTRKLYCEINAAAYIIFFVQLVLSSCVAFYSSMWLYLVPFAFPIRKLTSAYTHTYMHTRNLCLHYIFFACCTALSIGALVNLFFGRRHRHCCCCCCFYCRHCRRRRCFDRCRCRHRRRSRHCCFLPSHMIWDIHFSHGIYCQPYTWSYVLCVSVCVHMQFTRIVNEGIAREFLSLLSFVCSLCVFFSV